MLDHNPFSKQVNVECLSTPQSWARSSSKPLKTKFQASGFKARRKPWFAKCKAFVAASPPLAERVLQIIIP